MFRPWNLSKILPRSKKENWLKAKGYWPGAETNRFRLWWNDDDECVVEERSREDEAGSYD